MIFGSRLSENTLNIPSMTKAGTQTGGGESPCGVLHSEEEGLRRISCGEFLSLLRSDFKQD